MGLARSFKYCLHLPFSQVNVDDTLPLSHPIRTASGELVDSIFVAKGTFIRIPIIGINMSEELWGNDAGKFDPKRWLDFYHDEGAGKGRWTEIQGYKHLLTFGNGPRMCLGKNFAVTEIKVRVPRSRTCCVRHTHRGFRSSCLFWCATLPLSWLMDPRRSSARIKHSC